MRLEYPRSPFVPWYPFAATLERVGGGDVAIGVVLGVVIVVVHCLGCSLSGGSGGVCDCCSTLWFLYK
jgi:hypothetical protein